MKLKMKLAGQLRRREKIKLEGDLFEVIDKLIAQGIEAGDIKKLEDAGIYTCKDLMMHNKKKLKGIKGLTEAKIEKIYEAAKKIVNSGYIITGSDALTKLPASSMREGNEKVANFDTEETFCSRPKIIPAAESFGMDPGVVLDSSVHPSLPLPDLPSDLWESILLCARLPVRTLVQLTCSKRVWRDAVTSPIFVREYDLGEMGKTEKLVMKTQEKLSFCLFSTTTRNWTPITCPGELEGLTVVGSCRGLICLTEPVGLDLNSPMYLWNPSIRRIRQLPQGPVQVGEENSDIVPIVFGVGFDGSTYQYHVLKFWCSGFTPARNPAYQVEIYNVETNNWRRLPPLNEAFNDIPIWFESSYGFYKAGVLYWTLNRAHGDILSYNLASEIFAMEGFPVNLLQLEFPVTAAIHHRSISIALLNWGEQEEHCDVLVKLSVGDRGGYIWQHIWSLNPQRDFAVPRPLVCTPEAGYLMGYVHEVTHDRNLLLFNPDTNEEVEFPIELPLEEEDLYVDSYTESLQLF